MPERRRNFRPPARVGNRRPEQGLVRPNCALKSDARGDYWASRQRTPLRVSRNPPSIAISFSPALVLKTDGCWPTVILRNTPISPTSFIADTLSKRYGTAAEMFKSVPLMQSTGSCYGVKRRLSPVNCVSDQARQSVTLNAQFCRRGRSAGCNKKRSRWGSRRCPFSARIVEAQN